MWRSSVSCVATMLLLTLLLADNDCCSQPKGMTAVSAFLSSRSRTNRSIRRTRSMVANDALLPGSRNSKSAIDSANQPTRPTPKRQRRRPTKTRTQNKQPEWHGQEIPKDIPKLSDVMKDISVQEFSGDIVMPTSPRKKQKVHASGTVTKQGVHAKRPAVKIKKEPSPIPNDARPSNHFKSRQRQVPWRAGYNASTRTQARIKLAGNNRHRSNAERATAILQTLLNTPPHECNEANIVCALTLSAKAMLPSTPVTHTFRSLLLEVLDVLKLLVQDGRLSARQLCNAVWAIAKHYNNDNSILPPPPETTAMSSEDMVGVAEAWILQEKSDETPEGRLKETVDLIAMQLTELLQDEEVRQKPKVGELCMACWAYGVLQPRRVPPGWAVPPQLGRIPRRSNNENARKQRNVEFVTFEQWAQGGNDDEEEMSLGAPSDCIDCFFDAVGDALCKRDKSTERGTDNDEIIGVPLMEKCSWSEIANVAWAYASHGYCQTQSSEAAMRELAHEATIRLYESRNTVQPRDVAQLVWAIGTLQSDNFRLADDLVGLMDAVACHWRLGKGPSTRQRQRPLRQWSCPDLVQLAISAAHGRIDNRPLLRAVYEEAFSRLKVDPDRNIGSQSSRRNFRRWEVSVLLWAQARLYLRAPQGMVFERFASEAPKWLAQSLSQGNKSLADIGIGEQVQANLAWSLTVLEQFESKEAIQLFKAVFQEVSSSSEQNNVIQLEHAHQLWQALYMLEEECPSAVKDVPRWFRDYLQEKWSLEKARRKKSSARHRSLSDTLQLMNVAHYNEHDEDIDVAIVLREEASWTHQTRQDGDQDVGRHKVAVEFDGPNHFTRETGDKNGDKPRALGHTVLKYRLLKRQGWTVVRVPYYEFDKIPFWASMERQRYLQRLLKTHANIRFSAVDVSEYSAPVPNRQTRFD